MIFIVWRRKNGSVQIGEVVLNSLGWRVIFWILIIYDGVFLVSLLVLLLETLRPLVANGSLKQTASILFPLANE